MADSKRFGRYCWPLIMICGVVVLYLPRGVMDGEVGLFGRDFDKLHRYRIAFAQEHLANGTLPGWYPRELCGTPFWANVQNFPWIPTRLALLWLEPLQLFTVAVHLSAILAAGFTYLFARRLAISRPGGAVAGWTFAASGFYASRVCAGHLPLLEAYPALPLMLWLVDRAYSGDLIESSRRRFDASLAWIGLASAAISLAGHPQLSIYAFVASAVYCTVFAPLRRWLAIGLAMGCGVGIAMFSLLPFALLVARSTRVLPLDVASNDIPMLYDRLLAAFFPWRDGVPYRAPGFEHLPLINFPHAAYFWDTVSYVGWWPWIALIALSVGTACGAVRTNKRVIALVLIGIGALVLSLPWLRELGDGTGGTFLRSPARLIYIVTFGLCLAAGGALSFLRLLAKRFNARWMFGAGVVIACIHAWDLSTHSRFYIAPARLGPDIPAELAREIVAKVGDGRAAVDLAFDIDLNRRVDDVSFFDSIMLARSYRGLMAAQLAEPGYNNQEFPASMLENRALQMCGAKVLITPFARPGQSAWGEFDSMFIYGVTDAAPRVLWFPIERVSRGDSATAEAMLRDAKNDLTGLLIVDDQFAPASTQPKSPVNNEAIEAEYRRDDSDTISVKVDARASGYLRVLESFDPGWTATIDGATAEIAPANLMFMAVHVPEGAHSIELRYHTPGRALGIGLSAVAIAALLGLCAVAPRLTAVENRSRSEQVQLD